MANGRWPGSRRRRPAASPSLELADLSSLQQVRDVAARLAQLPRDRRAGQQRGPGGRRPAADRRRARAHHGGESSGSVPADQPAPAQAAGQRHGQRPGQSDHGRLHRAPGGRLNLDDLQLERHYSAMLAYSNSKTANILFTRELARRLAGTGVTANCLHPGTVATNFGQTGNRWLRYGLVVGRSFLRSPESGASTDRLPGQLARGRRPDRRILRRAEPPQAVEGRQGRRPRPPALGHQRRTRPAFPAPPNPATRLTPPPRPPG